MARIRPSLPTNPAQRPEADPRRGFPTVGPDRPQAGDAAGERRARYQRCTPAERHLLHESIARARLFQLPLRSTVGARWRHEYGTELPATFLKYAAHAKQQAHLREQYLREALDDPEVLATLNPVFAVNRLRETIEQALTPRPVRVPGSSPDPGASGDCAEQVAWVTEPDVAIRAVAELRRWMPYVAAIEGEQP